MNTLPPLPQTTILRHMPTARHLSLVCSAGSLGYHALKEMLLSGVPGNTLLIESGDVRDVVASAEDDVSCEIHAILIYALDEDTPSDPNYSRDLGEDGPSHVTIYTNMVSLPYGLLTGCNCLKSIDLSPVTPGTTVIQDFFLSRCNGLTTLDLSPLSHVQEIQWYFLSGCRGLTTIDLSPLSSGALTTIRSSFLSGCVGIKEIDLSPLSGVDIQGAFLQGCTGLTSIDLSPLRHLTEIQRTFLWECSGLEEVYLSPSVMTIDYGFLSRCPNLKMIDLSMSTLLEKLPESFMANFGDITVLPPHLMK